MTIDEISNEFDELLRLQGYHELLNEYLKSLLLTEALASIVMGFYTGKFTGDSFELSEALRRYLEPLIKQKDLTPNNSSTISKGNIHTSYLLDLDTLYIIYEEAKLSDNVDTCLRGSIIEVTPITHDSYMKTVDNPFRGLTAKRALRLDNANQSIELVSKYPISKYTIRYVSKPEPIILINLPSGLSIEGKSIKTTSNLPLPIVRMIILLAVEKIIVNNKKLQ